MAGELKSSGRRIGDERERRSVKQLGTRGKTSRRGGWPTGELYPVVKRFAVLGSAAKPLVEKLFGRASDIWALHHTRNRWFHDQHIDGSPLRGTGIRN